MDEAELHLRYRAKTLMRRRFRGRRGSLPASAVAARSAAIVDRLLDDPAVKAAGAVALFWPIEGRNEVDLRAADEALRGQGKVIAYPAIDDAGVMTFRRVDAPSALEPCELGFDAPPPDAVEVPVDVVVVPGLTFDLAGYRIGYGGGFYDQALPKHCPPAAAVGVVFDFLLAPDIPHTEGDVPVDRVITDARTMEVTRPAGGDATSA